MNVKSVEKNGNNATLLLFLTIHQNIQQITLVYNRFQF